jgi:hypothetical protein
LDACLHRGVVAVLRGRQGDRYERAEQLRVQILRDLAQRLAALAGWTPGHPDGDALLLRAQLVLCTGVGLAVLRATGGLEPICTTEKTDLAAPMGDLIRAMLG